MQKHLLETLRARLKEAGLGQYETAILPHARLAFDLILAGESAQTVGESRWGGLPDAPPDFEWPHNELGQPLEFLAQIDLAGLIEDPQNPFPNDGLLLFFASYEEDAARIFLFPAATELQTAALPVALAGSEDGFGQRAPQKLRIEARADLPQWATRDYDEIIELMTQDEQDAYGDAFNVTEGEKGDFAGQLLGHAAGIGSDPREDACVVREHGPELLYNFTARAEMDLSGAKKWLNLAVFDSVMALDFCIGDAGYFGLLIHEDDLKNLDFSRVYAHLQSS